MDTPTRSRHEQLFPRLSAAQLAAARRFADGEQVFAPDQIVFALGERSVPAWLVIEGSIAISRRNGAGQEELIHTHGPGEMTGEVAQLAGRATLAEGRAGPAGCRAVPFDAAHLRAMIIGSAELGEILMRALILRRAALITEGGAGSVLLGHADDPVIVRIEGFLSRNGYPYSVMDAGAEDARILCERLGLRADDLPIVLCPNGTVLRNPTEAEVGLCLGITPELDPARLYDVAVVGAGPAGLATAVYAASEGLSVLVLDSRAFGGQAGASARIENYLGFPTGITGQALTARAFVQAQKFGAEIAIPVTVEALDCAGEGAKTLRLAGGGSVRARSVVIASGVRYRRPDIADLARFEGAGVSYWASPVEARLCANEEIALVGAGNSAGQAVVFLAPHVRHLHLVIRGDGLEASMSRYLIERIAALPNVTLHRGSEIEALSGSDHGLEAARLRRRDTGESVTMPLRHLFLFVGADPYTGWLTDCAIAVDEKGFVTTGQEGRGALETSLPGVFAIGDVRAGSTKRVAAAVGEGAQAVAALHAYLS